MVTEILTSIVAAGIAGSTYVYQHGNSDHKKIERIAENCGLVSKDNQKIRIYRKTKKESYTEYVYKMPLGLSLNQFKEKEDHFQDGLNMKKSYLDISIDDIKSLRWNRSILQQIRKLFEKQPTEKEVLIDYDGMLIFKIYSKTLPKKIIYNKELLKGCKGWEIPIGYTRDGILKHDTDWGHMIVAGATRYGKSVFMKSFITSLIIRKPNDVKFTLIDLKGGLTMSRFRKLNQVKTLAINTDDTLEALRSIKYEMEKRQMDLQLRGFEDVKEAGIKERHFIMIDEAAQVSSAGVTDKGEKYKRIECESIISEIARIGAALGYRLIYATQYPTADCLPRQVKQNADTKICFRLQNSTASRVVLDEEGAEKLPKIQGRAVYLTPDSRSIVQTSFISNDEVEALSRPYFKLKTREESVGGKNNGKKATKRGTNTVIIEKTSLSD